MSFLIRLPSLFDSGTSTSTPVGSNRCNKLPSVPSFGAGLRPRIPWTNKRNTSNKMAPAPAKIRDLKHYLRRGRQTGSASLHN